MRAARQFGLGFGFTLIVGSPVAFTLFLTGPNVPSPRPGPYACTESVTAPKEPEVDAGIREAVHLAPGAIEDQYEGGQKSEEVVPAKSPLETALARLDRMQSVYGYWTDANEYAAWLEERPNSGPLELDDTALTALGLWCMVQDGGSHFGTEQCVACRIALTYLLSRGNGAGWYAKPTERNAISTQALVMFSLLRLEANTSDRSLAPVIEAALAATTFGNTGRGWGRSLSDDRPDAATTGWILSALYEAQFRGYDVDVSQWAEPCLDELEKQAKAETGEGVMARAVYLSCVAEGSDRSHGKIYESALEAVLLRANKEELRDMHETYWVACALIASRCEGIWRDAIRAKAEAATLQRDAAESEEWRGGEVYRLALGIRILQMLR